MQLISLINEEPWSDPKIKKQYKRNHNLGILLMGLSGFLGRLLRIHDSGNDQFVFGPIAKSVEKHRAGKVA